ncbi:MAG: transcription antitermination factor NusB [Firmicutes bacterium]|nr:transcription antitermination factor NusB [Candidatus Fermentithermobacillaceae bacterium]
MSARISRHDSRILALSALFSYHLTGKDPDQVFEDALAFYPRFSRIRRGEPGGASTARNEAADGCPREGKSLSSYVAYAKNLFLAAVENLKTLDELIESRAEGWTVNRMPVVDRCILELALAEVMYAGDAPTEVVLDEAVNLAKEYGTADTPAFVNGLLMGILRERLSPA